MNRQWILAARPGGSPTADCFGWLESALPPLEEGQIRTRNVYLSIDPAMRVWMAQDSYVPAVPLGAVMRGRGIGVVAESRNVAYPEGSLVEGMFGWQDYYTGDGAGVRRLPDAGLPAVAHLALLGHIGLTAYFGLMDIGKPKAGETLVVSAAAGAVGSLAGQMGKIAGCRVIGIAGTDEKCQWLTGELGFDGAINYRNEDVASALDRHCPQGIDIYFENVGGATLEAVLDRMNVFGRIPACGMISQYNNVEPMPGPSNLTHIVTKQLTMQGFLVMRYLPRANEAIPSLVAWHREGRLRYSVDISQGLASAPEALLQLFAGRNTGKSVVRIAVEPEFDGI